MLSNDGCNAACEVMPGYACVGGTEQQKDTCTPECGDGLKVGSEQCDDVSAPAPLCRNLEKLMVTGKLE